MAIKLKLKLEGRHAERFLKTGAIAAPEPKHIGEREGERMAGKFIQHAIKRPGALTQKARAAGMSVDAFARKHEHDTGPRGSASLRTGNEARFYEHTLKKVRPRGEAAHRAAEKGARTRHRHAHLPSAAGR